MILIYSIIYFIFFSSIKAHPSQDFPEYSLRYTYPQLCETNSKHTSGYFELPCGKNFFFWFFESRSNSSKDPLTLWLNGGPGCSSMLGLLMEVGPCRLNEDGDALLNNEYSWTSNSNMIFLDQPVNSGYSYHNTSTPIADSNAAANEVYIFLQLFFREFPQFAGSDFHIAGESYAGHFLPAIASKIHNSNQKNKSSIQLKSVLIGNGLIDPQTQYRYYKAMACENPTYPNLLTSSKACHELESNQDECQKEIKNCYQQTDFTLPTRDSAYACMVATSVCNLNVVKPVIENTDRNIYDIRKKCEDGPMCYDYFTAIKKYLDRSDVKHELGVSPSIQFELCSDTVNGHFQNTGDWMRPYVHQLTQLLDQGIRVLAYAGDSDLMCNWMGIRAWTLNLQWQGQPDYHNQDDVDYYTLNGTHAGTIRKNSGLAFIRLYNAGHMAPFDQPENTLDMFNRWISATL